MKYTKNFLRENSMAVHCPTIEIFDKARILLKSKHIQKNWWHDDKEESVIGFWPNCTKSCIGDRYLWESSGFKVISFEELIGDKIYELW
jgi:hypothetical protein